MDRSQIAATCKEVIYECVPDMEGKPLYEDTVININNGEIGPITQKFYDTITGIQSVKVEDKFGWVTKVN